MPRSWYVVTLLSILVVSVLLPVSAAGAQIEDHCGVRSVSSVRLSGAVGVLDAVTLDPTGRIVAATSVYDGPAGLTRLGVSRFGVDGSPDVAFGGGGSVDLGLVLPLQPTIAVGEDGRIWLTGFRSFDQNPITVFEISSDGLAVVEHNFGVSEGSFSGRGAVDASGPVMLSAVVLGPAFEDRSVVIIDVESEELVRDVSGMDGLYARSVSSTGVTAVEGDEMVLHSGPVAVVDVASELMEPDLQVAVRIGDALVYAGAAMDEPPPLTNFTPQFAVFGRQRVTGVAPVGELDGSVRLPDGERVVDISPSGVVAIELHPRGRRNGLPEVLDLWLGRVNLTTGEYERFARADRSIDYERTADLVEMTSGETWMVAFQSADSVVLAQLWADAPQSPREGALRDQIARLYLAYFERTPDADGQRFWEDERISGRSLAGVSQAFAQAPEFVDTYGSLTDEAFVELVYRNVLDRGPDAAGRKFWLEQLTEGVTRGAMMIGFSESAEMVSKTGTVAPSTDQEAQIARLYEAYFERRPDADGFCFWAGSVDTDGLAAVSGQFATSSEFVETYGDLDDAAFVDLVYSNVLGRQGDAAGRTFWLEQLRGGISRGSLMLQFSESEEFIRQTGTPPPL